jgi:outer membrane immunogenic protein
MRSSFFNCVEGVMLKRVVLAAAFAGSLSSLALADRYGGPVYIPASSWAGFYFGGNAGYSWGRAPTDVTFIDNATGVAYATVPNTPNLDGAVGGLQAGYNWQVDRIVLGAEIDIQKTGERGSATSVCPTVCSPNGPTSATVTPSLEWFQTLRGRVGIISSGVMVYVTGGVAYGDVKTSATMMGFGNGGAPVAGNASWSSTKVGWVTGAGLETLFGDRWSGRVEYLYLDLGSVTVASVSPFSGTFSSRVTDSVFRVGLNYRFR